MNVEKNNEFGIVDNALTCAFHSTLSALFTRFGIFLNPQLFLYGIAEVVGSNPAQSLNFFQVSVLVVFNGRVCIYYRYHSFATMGQISFIFTVLGPSQNVPI